MRMMSREGVARGAPRPMRVRHSRVAVQADSLGYYPPRTWSSRSRSMFPPLRISATFFPAIRSRSWSKRKWRGAGAFRDLVRVVEIGPHGSRDLVFADLHYPGGAATDGLDRLNDGLARGNPVRKGLRGRRSDGAPCGERKCRRGCLLGTDPYDFGLQAKQIAHRDQAADSGAHSDSDIDRVQIADCVEKLKRVTGDSGDEVPVE